MNIGLFSVLIPVIAGFLGGLFSLYYKENITEAKKTKTVIAKLIVMLWDFRKDMLEKPFKDLYLQGLILNKRYADAMTARSKKTLNQVVEEEDNLRIKIHDEILKNKDLCDNIRKMYQDGNSASADYLQVQIEQIKSYLLNISEREVRTEDLALLPNNVAYQAVQFRNLCERLCKWAIERLYHMKYKIFTTDDEMLEAGIKFCFDLMDIANISTTLAKNVEFLDSQSTAKIAFRKMRNKF